MAQLALDRLRPLILPVAFGAGLLLLWQALVVVFGYPKVILPAPSDIYAALVEDFAVIWQQSVPTVRDTLAGFALAALFGVGLASLLSFSRLLRDAIYPLIVVIQLVPKIAWTPLFIVWVGIGWQSRLTIAAFIGFFPIFIAMMAGLESTDRSLVRLCRGLTAAAEVRCRLGDEPGPLPAERPYTFVNFVASLDGRATVSGRSAPLSDPGDRALFHVLREAVDAVMAGTGTLRVERYGRVIKSAEARRRNIRFIAYNTRFLILPWIKVPHLASHILGRVTSALPGDWERMYSHPVYFAETFIDPGRFRGTCYRAANWVLLGKTTGRGKQSNSYVPNLATDQFRSTIVANEVSGTGYTARGYLISSVSFTNNSGIITVNFADITVAQNGAGFSNAFQMVIHNDTSGVDTTASLICQFSPGSTFGNTVSGFTIQIAANGWFTIT